MWFGSDQGLSRFDGKEFYTYTTKDGLPDNDVFYAEEDVLGRLWISSFTNQMVYILNGKVYTPKEDTSLRIFQANNYFGQIKDYQKNEIWILGSMLYRIDNKGKIHQYPNTRNINTGSGLYYQDSFYLEQKGALINLTSFHWIKYKQNLITPRFIKVIEDQGVLYGINDQFEVYQISINFNQFRYVGKFKNYLCLKKMTDGYLYASNNTIGVFRFHFTEFFQGKYDLIDERKNIRNIYIDHLKNIWLSTSGPGVYFLPHHQILNYSTEQGLFENQITALEKDGENIFLGYSSALIDRIDQNGIITIQIPILQGSGRINQIKSFGSYLYIGTEGGFFRYDLRSSKVEMLDKNPVKNFFVQNHLATLVSSAKTQWYDLTNDQSGENKKLENHTRITTALKYYDKLYIGTFNGLIVQHLVKEYSFQPMTNSRITSLAISRDSLIWVATSNQGIFIVRGFKIIASINSFNSKFFGDLCKKIIVDQNNNIWLITNRGISQIVYKYNHPKLQYTIQNFASSNLFPTSEVNDLRVEDSVLYIASSRGLFICNYHLLATKQVDSIFITKIETKDTVLNFPREVHLSSQSPDIKVYISAIDYSLRHELEYQYKLIGEGNTYIDRTTRNYIEFRNLEYGEYRLEIYASHPNEVWSKKPAVLKIIVHPRYWETRWFQYGLVVLFTSIIYAFYRRRLWKIRKIERAKTETNRKLSEYKLQAMKAKLNPHFIFNVLTAIQKFVLINDPRTANKFLTSFAKLMRLIFNHSSLDYISLQEEIQFLNEYLRLEQFRLNNKFAYQFEIDPQLQVESVLIPSILLQPFVENAIIHGIAQINDHSGQIHISFMKRDETLICIIEDNGQGIDQPSISGENQPKQLHSMSILKDRIYELSRLLNREITLNILDLYSEGKRGTRVELRIPFMKNRDEL